MPRKVTLPCRSLSCSRSDLSCCVSLRLKQYLPPRISTFHTWKRLSLFSTFAPYFASFRFHNVSPRYFNFDRIQQLSHPSCQIISKTESNRIFRQRFQKRSDRREKRFWHRDAVIRLFSINGLKEKNRRLSRDEKQGRSFIVIGWRSNKP